MGKDGTVWGVASNGDVYHHQNDSWRQITDQQLTQVSVGSSTDIWGVDSDGNIYQYNNQTDSWDRNAATDYLKPPQPVRLAHISAASDGTVLGVTADERIYRRVVNEKWQRVPGEMCQISVGATEVIWGLNSTNHLVQGSTASGRYIDSHMAQNVCREAIEGLEFLRGLEPDANVSFHHEVKFVEINATPGPGTRWSKAAFQDAWRNPAMEKLGYSPNDQGVNDYATHLARSHGTTKAYVAFFTTYPNHNHSYKTGVTTVVSLGPGDPVPSDLSGIFAHETCHIFGAADEYGQCGGDGSGHYDVPNDNCAECDCSPVPCVMHGNTPDMCKWTRGQLGWSFWEPIGGQELAEISVAGNGTVWGVASNQHVYRYAESNSWQQITGQQLTQVSVGSNRTIWGVASYGWVYHYQNNSWQRIRMRTLKQVSVASDGTVWGVASNGNVYRRSTNGSWTQITGQALTEVAVGSKSIVWGVDSGGNVYQYHNSSWRQVTGQKLTQISVASDGTVWGVNSESKVYQYQNNSWQQLTKQPLKQVSVASDGTVWGVDSCLNVHQYQNDAWHRITGRSLKQVSTASDGTVWGVDPDDNVYRYTGNKDWVAVGIQRGNRWTGLMTDVSVGSATDIWGVNSYGYVYKYAGNNSYNLIQGLQLKQISIGSDGMVYGIGFGNDNVYRNDYRHGSGWQWLGQSIQLNLDFPDGLKQ